MSLNDPFKEKWVNYGIIWCQCNVLPKLFQQSKLTFAKGFEIKENERLKDLNLSVEMDNSSYLTSK